MRKTFLSSLLLAAAWDSRMSSWDLDFGVSAQTTLQCWMIRVTHANCLNILSNCLTVLRCQIDQYRGRLLCQDVFTRILSVNRATSFNSIQHLHSAVFCCCDARFFLACLFLLLSGFLIEIETTISFSAWTEQIVSSWSKALTRNLTHLAVIPKSEWKRDEESENRSECNHLQLKLYKNIQNKLQDYNGIRLRFMSFAELSKTIHRISTRFACVHCSLFFLFIRHFARSHSFFVFNYKDQSQNKNKCRAQDNNNNKLRNNENRDTSRNAIKVRHDSSCSVNIRIINTLSRSHLMISYWSNTTAKAKKKCNCKTRENWFTFIFSVAAWAMNLWATYREQNWKPLSHWILVSKQKQKFSPP